MVLIDEAHHFRNPGYAGTGRGRPAGQRRTAAPPLLRALRSHRRHQRQRSKQVFLLTATPVNNRLLDLQHMIELFSRRQADWFQSLGIHSLPATSARWRRSYSRPQFPTAPRRPSKRTSPKPRRFWPAIISSVPRGAAQPGLRSPEPTPAGQDCRRLPHPRRSPSRRIFHQEDLWPTARHGRAGVRQAKAPFLPGDLLPLAYYKGDKSRPGGRRVRRGPATANRRPDPHAVPQTL